MLINTQEIKKIMVMFERGFWMSYENVLIHRENENEIVFSIEGERKVLSVNKTKSLIIIKEFKDE